MVELVDTPDLKSCGPQARAGSTPAPGTRVEKPERMSVQAFLWQFDQKRRYTNCVAALVRIYGLQGRN